MNDQQPKEEKFVLENGKDTTFISEIIDFSSIDFFNREL